MIVFWVLGSWASLSLKEWELSAWIYLVPVLRNYMFYKASRIPTGANIFAGGLCERDSEIKLGFDQH